jgi:hypothetical protein
MIFSKAPENNIRVISNFFENRGDIRKANFATGTAGVVDTGGKLINEKT